MEKNVHELIALAREEMSKITGLELGSTLATAKDERGWLISMELVEKHAIPDQMDILATYDVIMDEAGKLVEFNRKSMRKRVDTNTEEVD